MLAVRVEENKSRLDYCWKGRDSVMIINAVYGLYHSLDDLKGRNPAMTIDGAYGLNRALDGLLSADEDAKQID